MGNNMSGAARCNSVSCATPGIQTAALCEKVPRSSFISAPAVPAWHLPPAALICNFLPHIPVWTSVLLHLHPTAISGCISPEAQDTCSDTQASSGQVGLTVCFVYCHNNNIIRSVGCRKVIRTDKQFDDSFLKVISMHRGNIKSSYHLPLVLYQMSPDNSQKRAEAQLKTEEIAVRAFI